MTDFDRIRELLAGIEADHQGLREDHDTMIEEIKAHMEVTRKLEHEAELWRRRCRIHRALALAAIAVAIVAVAGGVMP